MRKIDKEKMKEKNDTKLETCHGSLWVTFCRCRPWGSWNTAPWQPASQPAMSWLSPHEA